MSQTKKIDFAMVGESERLSNIYTVLIKIPVD
jgi:hypothetical protein